MRGAFALEDALAFAARHPVGHLDESIRRRLLTQLTSAPEGTIVIGDASGALVLVATVVDVVADAAAPAELAILGARPGLSSETFAEEVLGPAIAFARSVGRRALYLARPAFVAGIDTVLARAGWQLAYETVFMRRTRAPLEAPAPPFPPTWRWVPLEDALVSAVHEALVEIFRDAPSTTLPPLAEFRRGAFASRLGWQVLLEGASIAGVVRLSAEGSSGEVRILGRRPAYRGRGLGPRLLDHGLRVLAGAGAAVITLEVAATNERALALYRGFDFEVVERSPTFGLTL